MSHTISHIASYINIGVDTIILVVFGIMMRAFIDMISRAKEIECRLDRMEKIISEVTKVSLRN